MRKLPILFIIFLAACWVACANVSPPETGVATVPVPTALVIPPTFTPAPASSRINPTIPVVTVTQAPPPPTNTPIPFGANVVEVRLRLPSVGLDRRLQGGVSSQIILVDESSGFSVQRDNQASVLLDLQQVLPELDLSPVPEDCQSCVQLTYSLPFSGVEDAGWLRDPVLLASLENYFTTSLGPHFPPESIIGLRRSASPYAPAHSVAVTADGRLFRWLASEGEAAPVGDAPPELLAAFEQLDPPALSQQYTAPCPGTPLESLLLAGRDNERLIALVCPEFALPISLQPLYVSLDDLLTELLEASANTITRPPAGFPLAAVLDYQRVDGAQLTILIDDTAVVSSGSSQPITVTLSSSQVISLTTNLLDSGSLRTGLTTFLAPGSGSSATATPNAPRTVLLVRGPAGVYDAQWFNRSDVPVLAELNDLLNEILVEAVAAPGSAIEGTPEPVATGETENQAAATETPSAPGEDE